MMKKKFTSYYKNLTLLAFVLIIGNTAFGQIQATIGAGLNSSTQTGFPTPMGNWYWGQKMHALYTSAELSAAGVPSGAIITEIAYNVINPNSCPVLNGFEVKYKASSTAAFVANAAWETGFTSVFSPATGYQPILGWNTFNLTTPLIWNGVDNIIIETCSNNGSYVVSGNASVQQTTSLPGNFCAMRFDDNGNVCPNPTNENVYSTRPNIRITYTPGTPCTGMPVAGTVSPASLSVCSGQQASFTATGFTLAGSLNFSWQASTNGGVTWIPYAGTSPSLTTPALTQTTQFRMIVTCTTSGLSDTSNIAVVNVAPPAYAALPYIQDFETWSNYCNTNDVPNDNHWSNNPATGNDSWRRNDEGLSGGWNNPNFGMYNPASSSGQYSARYHSYYGAGTGNLDMYVDCSSSTGNKTLAFDYINISGNDFIQVEFSPNGGLAFIPLVSFNNSTTWQTQYVTIPSNAANTIIRFKASGGTNFTAASDIGLDNVKLLAPCTGAVVAGAIDSVTPCSNQPFNLNITGSSQAGGLTYDWESAPSAAGLWTNFGTTAGPTINTTIPGPTYIRCIVTCTASSQADTTAVRFVDVGSFWVCYCQSMATVVNFENIGNVLIQDAASDTLLNNGNPLPLTNNTTSVNVYSNFTALPATTLFKDSIYSLKVSGIANDGFFSNTYCAAYIDFNRDGVYDPISERVFGSNINSSNNQSATANFPIPANASFGLTGMRIVFQVFGNASTISPCGLYNNGETEDYVVNIAPSPCISPPNAGMAFATDTATCPGTAIIISNTTYDKIYANLNSSWQLSTDGINYSDIPGANLDSLTVNPTVDSWYRFRVTCNGTSNSFSNVQKVSMLPATSCFGLSATTGTLNDSSDIGGLVISTPQPTNINLYSFTSGGPHLLNPAANRFYTNYTPTGVLDLYADSTYKLSIYHIMSTATHGDAKVTVFIDYNNNFNFDLPNELVYSGIADVNNFFLNAEIVTPVAPALNVPVGMRIVLNNDIGPNGASDTGYGTYVSGETEDFFVRFSPYAISTNVEDFNDLKQIGLYPNPTSGLVYIGFNATKTLDVDIDVLSVTGAKVLSKHIDNVSGNYSSTMDLSSLSPGIYMMKFITEKGDFVRRITVE